MAPLTELKWLSALSVPFSRHRHTRAHTDAEPRWSVFTRADSLPQAYALYRTRLPACVTHQALLLLTRLKSRYPSARGTATSPHRLFLASLMLSSKISMDDTYSNKSWQIVGQGLFDLKEVNQMERELFAFLGHNVCVSDAELRAFVADIITPLQYQRGLAQVASQRAARAAAAQAAAAAAAQHQQASTSRPESSASAQARAVASEPEARGKRRRSSPSISDDVSLSSRSTSSLEDARHRRASDAALALLRGTHHQQQQQQHAAAAMQHRKAHSHAGSMRHSAASSGYATPERIASSHAGAQVAPPHLTTAHAAPASSSSYTAPSTASSSAISSPTSFAYSESSTAPASPATPMSSGPHTPQTAIHGPSGEVLSAAPDAWYAAADSKRKFAAAQHQHQHHQPQHSQAW